MDKKSDAGLVVASYGRDAAPLTLGRYQSTEEALEALDDLLAALAGGESGYAMKASTGAKLPLEGPREWYHGKKPKRRGGS